MLTEVESLDHTLLLICCLAPLHLIPGESVLNEPVNYKILKRINEFEQKAENFSNYIIFFRQVTEGGAGRGREACSSNSQIILTLEQKINRIQTSILTETL